MDGGSSVKYRVYLSANIQPVSDEDGQTFPSGMMLNYSRTFEISGENFTEIAPRIDAVSTAIELVADSERAPILCAVVNPAAPLDAKCLYLSRCATCVLYNAAGFPRNIGLR